MGVKHIKLDDDLLSFCETRMIAQERYLLTKTNDVLYVLRGHRMVEWEGPLRPSTKIIPIQE